MESKQTAYYKTPIGTAKIVGDENGVSSVSVLDEEIETSQNIPTCLKDCIQQLDEYFKQKVYYQFHVYGYFITLTSIVTHTA